MLSFTEILIILVIAFIVLGPEEFPKIVKKFLQFINELKSTFSSMKKDLSQVKSETEELLLKESQNLETSLKKNNPPTPSQEDSKE